MNDFSLYENVPIRNQDIKAITNQGNPNNKSSNPSTEVVSVRTKKLS